MGFRGNLPDTEEQFNELISLVRRVGHVHQHGGIATTAMPGGHTGGQGPGISQRGHAQGQYFFPTMTAAPGQ
eukprot:3726947-Pyramimonas_sp.AAC.1